MVMDNQTPASSGQPGASIHVCRSAWLSPDQYSFYRAILLTFPQQGQPPSATELITWSDECGIDLEETLQFFARQDLVQMDALTGEIVAAYPFSSEPTAHQVRFDRDAEGEPYADLYAMCAIDALGVPLMLRHPAWINSRDAVTGEPVQVRVVPTAEGPLHWSTTWEPTGAVAFARPEGHEHEHDCGSSAADNCCGLTRFFADAQHAAGWSASHAATDGRIYTQEEALEYAATLFAGILDRAIVPTAGQSSSQERPHVQLLYFAACPNTPQALEELQRVLASDSLPTDVELIAVETQAAAEAHQFYGSPTIRIDGIDVAAIPIGATPSLSCRLYALPDGRVAHHPPTDAIAAALQRALAQAHPNEL